MTKKIVLFFVITFSLILMNSGAGICEGEETAQEQQAQEAPAAEPEIQWIWGEAVSVDAENRALSVRYLDYETDTEKEISIQTDDSTNYENVNSISEIKPQDALSVDYSITPDGRNLAKNISVEKPENLPALPQEAPKDEAAPTAGTEVTPATDPSSAE